MDHWATFTQHSIKRDLPETHSEDWQRPVLEKPKGNGEMMPARHTASHAMTAALEISRRGARRLLISVYPPPVLPANLVPALRMRVPAFPYGPPINEASLKRRKVS